MKTRVYSVEVKALKMELIKYYELYFTHKFHNLKEI